MVLWEMFLCIGCGYIVGIMKNVLYVLVVVVLLMDERWFILQFWLSLKTYKVCLILLWLFWLCLKVSKINCIGCLGVKGLHEII